MKDDTTSDNAANLRPMRLRKLGGWIGIVFSLPVFFMFLVHFSGVLNPGPKGKKIFDASGTLLFDSSVLYTLTSADYLRLLYTDAGEAIVFLLLILLAPPPGNKKMKFLWRFCAALQVAVLIGTVAAMAIVKL